MAKDGPCRERTQEAELPKTASNTMIPRLKVLRKTGSEPFCRQGKAEAFTLLDFWQWSTSDLVDNTQRGVLAEYLVAQALKLGHGLRTSWDPYDLQLESGIRIEVKSSAYIQSWFQKGYSKVSFSIKETHSWSDENGYESEIRRQAQIYVFCILKHKDPTTIDPLNLDQWDFIVVPASKIAEKYPNHKSISLIKLRELGFPEIPFEQIADTVAAVVQQYL